MSMSSNSHLPKPPPKGLPQASRGPVAAPPAAAPAAAAPRPLASMLQRLPFGGASASAPATSPAPAPKAPAAGPSGNGGMAAAAPVAATEPPTPKVDTKGFPENLAQMVEAMTVYDQLLIEENALLRAGDAKGVSALVDRKMAATRLYQERLRAVMGDGGVTRGLAPEQRAGVVSLVKCLETRAQENATLLKANMNAIEQVFEVINSAARKMRQQEVGYSKAGALQENYARGGVSWAHNTTI